MVIRKNSKSSSSSVTAAQGQIRLLRLVDTGAASDLRLQQWQGAGWRECVLPEAFGRQLNLEEPEAGGSQANSEANSEATADSAEALQNPAIAQGDKVILLLPGHWVWSGVESIPKAARRQPRAVGYMVEERLAGDVEDLHFVCLPRRAGQCTVYAVDRERMAFIHEAVGALGWPMHAVIPEYQLLDRGDESVNRLWLDGDHAHLWLGEGRGVSMRREYLNPVVEGLATSPAAADAGADVPVTPALEVLGDAAGMLEAELQTLFDDRVAFLEGAPEALLLSNLKSAKLANLLTGEFKPDESAAAADWWRWPARVAAACFVLQLLGFVVAGSYFHWRAASVESEAEALFSQLFPNDTPGADIRRQVEGYLRQSAGNGDAFVGMMQELGRVWSQGPTGLRLQSLRFDGNRGDMVLQLQAKNLTDLDNAVGKLSAGKVRAELLAANELEEGVSGRIRLR
ncbi:hypothetical protein Maes01_00101 [Microbulbifer aestuariivivens]|uniref:Type II secretion system protein L n=1 Tax=Microbulbifer aestuariivivens TaxID=1908308 RepID=A0ABP9WMN4_9GAMM